MRGKTPIDLKEATKIYKVYKKKLDRAGTKVNRYIDNYNKRAIACSEYNVTFAKTKMALHNLNMIRANYGLEPISEWYI